MELTREEKRKENKKKLDSATSYLRGKGIRFEAFENTYLINVKSIEGLQQSYYVSTGTAIFLSKDHGREIQKNCDFSTFLTKANIAPLKAYKKREPILLKNKNSKPGELKIRGPRDVISLYNIVCISLPKVTKISTSRINAVKSILKKYSKEEVLKAFEKAENSKFLRGEIKSKGHERWIATFDWIIKESNMAKILDGNYDNRASYNHVDQEEIKQAQERIVTLTQDQFCELNSEIKNVETKTTLVTRPGFYEHYMNNPVISAIIDEKYHQFIKDYISKNGVSYTELFETIISDFKGDYEKDPDYPMKVKEMLKKETPGKGYFKAKQYEKEKSRVFSVAVNFRLKMFFDDYAWYERLSGKDALENIINSFIKKNQTDQIITRAEMFERTFGFKVDPKLRPCGIVDCQGRKCDDSCEYKNITGKEFWETPYTLQNDCKEETSEEVNEVPFPLTKEEESLLKLKEQGVSFNKIADKFGLSKTSVEDRYYKLKRLIKLSEEDELFRSIYITLGREHIGLYHLLRRAGIFDNKSLLELSRDDLLYIDGIGKLKASLLAKVQNAIK